jgi:hypothetical protein
MVLRLHDAVATLSLSPASTSPSEEEWDAYTPAFTTILSLSRAIMEAEESIAAAPADGGCDDVRRVRGRVGLDTGVLGPLYLVALRCRDPVVRGEAVRLLGREGRREGLWDSNLLARVAERVVGIEGCGGEGEGEGERDEVGRRRGSGRRVEDVDLVFDPEEGCKADVRFLMECGGCGSGGGSGIVSRQEGEGLISSRQGDCMYVPD